MVADGIALKWNLAIDTPDQRRRPRGWRMWPRGQSVGG